MKPESAFDAGRKVARHCPELLATEASTGDLGPALALLGERLSRTLALGLARLSGGDAPKLTAGHPRECTMATIAAEAAALASHGLLAIGPEARTMLATFDAAPVFRLVDRAFGGRGEVPDPMPTAFPLSAELLVGRLETTLATALGAALGGGAAHEVVPLRRDTSLRQLSAYAEDEAMFQLAFVVQEERCEPWMLSLSFPRATLAALFSASGRPARKRKRAATNPADEPFGSMPLTVTAVLVDMAIGFSKLSSLKPGDVLPVAVARSVPLKIGEQTIATGIIGDLDDRVAIRINHAF